MNSIRSRAMEIVNSVNCSILLTVYSVYCVREKQGNRTVYTAEREKCVYNRRKNGHGNDGFSPYRNGHKHRVYADRNLKISIKRMEHGKNPCSFFMEENQMKEIYKARFLKRFIFCNLQHSENFKDTS